MDEMLPLACWSPVECSVMSRKNNPTQKRPTSRLHLCVKAILGAAQIGAWRGRASVGEAQACGTPTWRCPGGRAGAPCPLWPALWVEPLQPFERFSRALTCSCPRPIGAAGSKAGHEVLFVVFSANSQRNTRCKGFKVSFLFLKNYCGGVYCCFSNLPFLVSGCNVLLCELTAEAGILTFLRKLFEVGAGLRSL